MIQKEERERKKEDNDERDEEIEKDETEEISEKDEREEKKRKPTNKEKKENHQVIPKSNIDLVSWKIIDTYFNENPNNLVAHHLESYNHFFHQGIFNIFRENNPIRWVERKDESEGEPNECQLFLGGKEGNKIYFGKPIIYDDQNTHYMFPNDARLRNMTYGITIHYDVDVDFLYYTTQGEKKTHSMTLEKIFLGRFPIMLQSDLCILKGLAPEVRFNMGECRNDFGGYFIIDGKEKCIVSQEKLADNMLYIRKFKEGEIYSVSAEIRSVSEDASKPIRTSAVRMVSPTPALTNQQIVVSVPNVRKPVPLFILMRALGIYSDKEIIQTCLLDLKNNESLIDLFIPSVHDANYIFNQETALRFIATFTKRGSVSGVLEILTDYFLPHVGEMNFLEKAYFVGYMVYRLLRVHQGIEPPTDRDNFRFKRIELSGTLIYDLFREYYLIQQRAIYLQIDKEYYYHKGAYKEEDENVPSSLEKGEKASREKKDQEGNKYKDNFISLIESNFTSFFKVRDVETGFRKAFKGNWGSQEHTKRLGVVQDLNRLSWNSFISHLRKINLPLDASAKVVGPRLLNSSQWGYIDPIDTPDGGNIGLHKHMAISTVITSGYSAAPFIVWLKSHIPMKNLLECDVEYLSATTKLFVNGNWIGVVDTPLKIVEKLRLYRRNGILPVFTSISFDYKNNEITIYTDSGRLNRPIYYVQKENDKGKGKEKEKGRVSYDRANMKEMIKEGKLSWSQLVSGIKKEESTFSFKENKIYEINELFSLNDNSDSHLEKNASILDYIDTAEEESAFIANSVEELESNNYYTNMEIDPSLLLGVMGNQIIYPENNPVTRDSFSCGQSKQAVSVYHSNYNVRMDKMGVVLNYGQIPLIKSRYLEYLNNEQQPYGVNAIVAIMSYTGYNVEDAILINEASVQRGIFRTTYFSTYEAREESSKVSGMVNSKFANIEKNNVVGIKRGYDYSLLDDYGMIKEETLVNDKMVLIGKIIQNLESTVGVGVEGTSTPWIDSSVTPKKGQLGLVDRSFVTQGEEGFNIAKVRIREERIPAIGDKMASRAGQKGTIGLIIPESDMPFTADGIRPDLIINPHAIPSRMTIGQLIESFFGKACAMYGSFGDCTAFQVKGSNYFHYGDLLVNMGYHSSGNEVMYNGMTGDQLQADIFMGPTYYMRLKHMVKDKINYRATGPRTQLTRQTVQGRANDGGLRIGEMERDGILAHGASYFLNESFLVRGDEYYMAVCNKTGAISIYNHSQNLFLSPFIDGPIHFHSNPDGSLNIKNVSRFGRSFSLLRVPYAFKLLVQELQAMNVQMRVITEDNVDQLMNMSYSDNLKMAVKPDAENLEEVLKEYTNQIQSKTRLSDRKEMMPVPMIEKYEEEEEKKLVITAKDQELGKEQEKENNATMLQKLLVVDKHTLAQRYKNYLADRNRLEEETGEKQPLILPIQSGDEIYIRVKNPDGSTSVSPRFPGELNYYFSLLSEPKKYEILVKPPNDQIRILQMIAEREKTKQGQGQGQGQGQIQTQTQTQIQTQNNEESPGFVPNSSISLSSENNDSDSIPYAPNSPAYQSNEIKITTNTNKFEPKPSILMVEEPKKDEEKEEKEDNVNDIESKGEESSGGVKKITL